MEPKLFSYKRKAYRPAKEGEEKQEIWYTDTFNPEYIIRTVEAEGGIAILLDDGHEMSQEEPEKNLKTNKIEYKRVRNWHQSECYLVLDEDKERFWKLTF